MKSKSFSFYLFQRILQGYSKYLLHFNETIKKFFALSRVYHCVLDIAAPAFCATLWLGGLPPLRIIALGLLAAFSGYLSIYALNDLIGFKTDQNRFAYGTGSGYAVEATDYHHPIARGLLSYRAGWTWMTFWILWALIGSYLLNPIIPFILIIGGILEFLYCYLLTMTYWRFLLSGFVKACGPIAAIFAVDHTPSLGPLLLLFCWVFLWEIGGQNIPADWNDQNEDLHLGARTIPIWLGPQKASPIILMSLIIVVLLSCFLSMTTPFKLGYGYTIANIGIGYYLLIRPAMHLYKTKDDTYPAKLFDKASYYPLALLISLLVLIFARSLSN